MLKDDMYELVLLEPFGGNKCGDVISVNRGIYNTMLNLKKALPLNYCEDDLDDKTRLTINSKQQNEEIEELYDANRELSDKLEDADDEIKELKNRVKELESCKDKRTTKRTKRTNRKVPNKKIKDAQVDTKNF